MGPIIANAHQSFDLQVSKFRLIDGSRSSTLIISGIERSPSRITPQQGDGARGRHHAARVAREGRVVGVERHLPRPTRGLFSAVAVVVAPVPVPRVLAPAAAPTRGGGGEQRGGGGAGCVSLSTVIVSTEAWAWAWALVTDRRRRRPGPVS